MRMRRLGRWFGFVFLALAIFGVGTWCAVGLWYQVTMPEPFRLVPPTLVGVFSLATVACLATGKRWVGLGAFLGAFVVFLVWWATIAPTADRDWAPEIARLPTAVLNGEKAVVTNVRNFTWRSETDFDPVWETRTYDLSTITDVDLIMSYWMGEAIAHTIVSFGFADGQRLAFSIETRKERHEGFSSVAGFFKQFELAIVAADERDVVRVRSNVRGEDVRLYRLQMSSENGALLFREYLEEANDLARMPRFYNTATSNCTTLVFDMVRVIHPGLPLDYRVAMAGYLPDYAYAVGALDKKIPFERLRELAKIHDKAIQADADPDFSAKIREGIPRPH
jgi:Domain of unknown function (DUF4105)